MNPEMAPVFAQLAAIDYSAKAAAQRVETAEQFHPSKHF